MKRAAGILALVLVVSLLGGSDVRGAALAPAGKTTGPALTAAIVIDVTEGGLDEGQTSIRVQKAGSSAAVLFNSLASSYLRLTVWTDDCTASGLGLQQSTNFKFVGKMDGWVPEPARTSLLGQFGVPGKAAITDTDYAACTIVGLRKILSFTAVIQFEP